MSDYEYRIEERGGINVIVCPGYGCYPANEAEIWAFNRIAKLEQRPAVTDAQLRKKAADRYRASPDSVVATAYLDGYRAAIGGGDE